MNAAPFLSFFAMIFFLVACGNDPSSDSSDEGQDSTTASEGATVEVDGQKIFRTYCITCHGIDGKLNLNGAKDLGISEMEIDEKVLHITNGKGLMTPFNGILTEEEIKAVAEYTFTFIPEE